MLGLLLRGLFRATSGSYRGLARREWLLRALITLTLQKFNDQLVTTRAWHQQRAHSGHHKYHHTAILVFFVGCFEQPSRCHVTELSASDVLCGQ